MFRVFFVVIFFTINPYRIRASSEFVCQSGGLFSDPEDSTCKKYYYCAENSTSYAVSHLNCPSGEYFDQETQICSTTTTGKCTASSSQEDITSTRVSAATENGYSCKIDPDYNFECAEKGRFANYDDLTCQRYFLCSKLKNGTFIKTEYSCPASSYFDQSIQICSQIYVCPCSTNSKTTPSTAAESAPSSAFTTTEESVTTTVTLLPEPPVSSTESEISTVGSTTTVETCIYEEDPEYFQCTEKGRFANLNDPSCETYYLCSKLKNGTFIKTEYSCPASSYFDQSIQTCSQIYVCPCSTNSTTTPSTPAELATSTVITTTEGSVTATVTLLPDPSVSSTESELSTIGSTTTVETCIYEEDPEYFQCTEKGRFANLNDPSCETYYLCSKLKNGTFIKTEYSCPASSYFDQSIQTCSQIYVCPCSTNSTTTPSTPAELATSTVITTTEGSVTATVTLLPDPSVSSTESELSTVGSTTTVETCIYEEDPEYFQCTEKGRFANLNDPSCETYYLCSKLKNGTFIKTEYSCPASSYFDQSIQTCSQIYVCPCSTNSTTTPSTPAELATSTVITTTEGSVTATVTLLPDPSVSSTESELSTVGSTTTVETCIYEEDPEYFQCTEKGRFANLNDPSCETYYLCSKLKNGTFIKTEYSCPASSYFDQSIQTCSQIYVCPCSTNSTTTPSTPAELATSTVITTTEGSVTATVTLLPDPSVSSTESELSTIGSTTTVETCIYEEDPEYFQCTEKGRFANLNDPSCETYYLCSKLKNGTFIKTEYSCPASSYFDQSIQTCSQIYVCPCSTNSTTTPSTPAELATSTVITTTEGSVTATVTLLPDPSVSSTESELSTIGSTTTVETCIYEEDPEYFQCTEKGRFANLNDPSCETYYLCSKLKNGTFIKTEYSCPASSYFDQSIQTCSQIYVCPCSTNSTTTPSTPAELATSTVITTTEGSVTATVTLLPDPSVSSTESELSTVGSTTTVETCIYEEDPEYFQCTEKGRFANLNDPSCETYYLCSKLKNGTFIKTEYSCPASSYFDQSIQTCSQIYVCPCSTNSTTTPSTPAELATSTVITTTEGSVTATVTLLPDPSVSSTESELSTIGSTTTVETCIYEEDPEYFQCTEKGRFANLNDPSCETYYLCSKLKNGTFIKTEYSCPASSYFDQSIQTCSQIYVCPCSTNSTTTPSTPAELATSTVITTTEGSVTATVTLLPDPSVSSTESELSTIGSTTTVETCIYEEDPEYFQCTEKGRFANLNDPSCETYYLCSKLKNGTFIKTEYSCPASSYFDQSIQTCSQTYVCPCSTNSTTTPSTPAELATSTVITTTEGSVTATVTLLPDPSVSSTESELSTIGSTTTVETCIYEEDPEYFQCTEKGRFANLNDPSCETYYLCSKLKNGTFIKTEYSCPASSYFDQSIQTCSQIYVCPCSINSTTTPSTPAELATSTVITTTEGSVTATITLLPDPSVSSTESELSTIGSTTTVETCIYEEDPEYFQCTEKGRFANLNDPSCETYYLCSKLKNGTFIKTEYSCPASSYFDQSIQTCSQIYVCPCSTNSTTTPSTPAELATSTVITTTEGSVTATVTLLPDPSVSSTESELSTIGSTTTVETCFYEEDPEYFQCTEKGRFANLNDPSCETYYLCSKLKNGTFIKTEYSCPASSYFDQSIQTCSQIYVCPCSTNSTTTPSTPAELATSTVITTTEGSVTATVTLLPDPSVSSTKSELSTIGSTTTVETCIYEEDPEYFQCTEKGRFANLNDPSCETYYLCSKLKNGTFIKTEYSCPASSYFDQSIQTCSQIYVCPCSANSTTTPSTPAELATSTVITTTEGSVTATVTLLPDPSVSSTESELSTIGSTTTVETCIYEEDPEYFQCTEKGRFANLNDPSCETYYLCSKLKNGTFIKTEYSCPASSYFDQSIQTCSQIYVCPCSTNSTTTPSTPAELATSTVITTTEGSVTATITLLPDPSVSSTESEFSTIGSTTTVETCIYKEDPEYFQCTEKGRFANLNDQSCETYYLCSKLKNGTFIKTEYSCPANSYFDQSIQTCSQIYVCPCSINSTTTPSTPAELATSTVITPTEGSVTATITLLPDPSVSFTESEISTIGSTTTVETCTYEEDPEYFQCTEKGRFANLNDPTCETYYLCSKLKNGTFIKTEYSCPATSYFDQSIQTCSQIYVCPCTAASVVTTTEVGANEPTVGRSVVSIAEKTSTTTKPCILREDDTYFDCDNKDRLIQSVPSVTA